VRKKGNSVVSVAGGDHPEGTKLGAETGNLALGHSSVSLKPGPTREGSRSLWE